ncbi:uncharacterized protein DUF1275 [Pseudomonas sp. LP_7_YM]|nr:uncharacterized protein DUF1275 [Pseudomonas sp. LP_7_YM]
MLPEIVDVSAESRREALLQGRVGLCLVAGLSFVAGMTDAIGFMSTGDVVSFMSGNTTRLAVSLHYDGYGRSTRGAFYHHFQTKTQVYSESIAHAGILGRAYLELVATLIGGVA